MNDNEIRRDMITARDDLIEIMKSELMGPGSELNYPDIEHELISSSPLSRYSVGILFPQGNLEGQDNNDTISPDNDDTVSSDDEEIASLTDENAADENVGDSTQKSVYKSDNTPDDGDTDLDDITDKNLDEEISMASQFKPSSMGITFTIKGDLNKIKCNVSYATYRKAKTEDCFIPYEVDNADTYTVPTSLAHFMYYDNKKHAFGMKVNLSAAELRKLFERDDLPENDFLMLKNIAYRLTDILNLGYVREPHKLEGMDIYFADSDYKEWNYDSDADKVGVKLTALRTKIKEDMWSVTVMFVNTDMHVPAKPYHCVYQSEISVKSDDNEFVFVESDYGDNSVEMSEEEQGLALLYRNKKNYGTGLGTSIEWDIDNTGHGTIKSNFFPTIEVPSMSFSLPENDSISNDKLSMKFLSDLSDSSKANKIDALTKLVDLYVDWINNLKGVSKTLDPKYLSAASKNIDECSKAAERMYAGIETLNNNETAYSAFLLANRSMFMQRIHIQKQCDLFRKNADRYPEDEEISEWLSDLDYRKEDDSKCRWRPFQIAFLLMDINSIVFNDSPDRSLIDLIWFPTGGGKTEAYLGLTAFTIFYRKLNYPDSSGGTAVMMRYTLRLLASQQFTRAATLICACEYIRQDCSARRPLYPKYQLGKEPITIGLWIGGTHIPNKNTGYNSADEHLKKLLEVTKGYYVENEKEKHNKFQVLKCPWCGTKLVKDEKNGKLVGDWGYAMKNNKFFMFCPHEDCTFTNNLPIQVVDDELYEKPPTLLFGTVDKFAMMPWDGRIGAFFGTNSKNRSPELIIQDELHLISGALGTMVGLYETAIDSLSQSKGIAPKIIASTATIRKAKEQCSELYNREVVQFPAPGLNAEDSFFAREDSIDHTNGKYGRKYVGIMPSGKTKAMTEIRAMAALLQKTYTMDLPDDVKDKLWTLTVYFNSLKDLGKASTMVEDDVKDFIIRTANRMLQARRLVVKPDELTSRISTTELNATLDKLEKIEYSKDKIEKHQYASNILLATNMISVGIDVARLNVMLMVGQPKLTSEYIQASSRVGRSYPGVAFVQYDATKSRDRSHYERFKAYHESFYKYVESTGVTPFSAPARDRALHSVLVSILRQKLSMSNDSDAALFDKEYFADKIKESEDYIVSRAEQINKRAGNVLEYDTEEIKREIEAFIDYWQNLAEKSEETGETKMCFGRKYMVTPPPGDFERLLKPYNTLNKDSARETLTSMRNVDTQVKGQIIVWED